MLTCSRCQRVKPFDEFYVEKRWARGYSSACRTCTNAWKQNNSERINAKRREAYKASPEKYREQSRLWAQRHPEKLLAYASQPENYRRALARSLAWKERNREALRAQQNERYQSDLVFKAKRILRQQERREWQEAGDLAVEQWLEVWDSFNGMCAYCSNKAESIDHVVPRTAGGKHTKNNVVPACLSCNISKRADTLLNWLARSSPRPERNAT